MTDDTVAAAKALASSEAYSEQMMSGMPPFLRTFLNTALPSLVLVILFLAVVYGLLIPTMEENFLSQKKELCSRLVEAVISDLDSRQLDVEEGRFSKEEMQARAIKRLRRQRYGAEHKDYVWIVGPDGRFLMHPYRPDLEAEDPQATIGPDGKPLSLLLGQMQEAVSQDGGGFIQYRWHWKDNLDLLVNKVSYVQEFAPWGWIIGTGVYIDDIQEEAALWRKPHSRHRPVTDRHCIRHFSGSLHPGATPSTTRTGFCSSIGQQRNASIACLWRTVLTFPLPCDQEGRFTYINPRLSRLGIESSTLLGEPFTVLVNTSDRARVTQQLEEAVTQGTPFELLFRLARSGGAGGAWVEVRAACLQEETQGHFSVNGILRDVNQRQEAQQALQESEENLRITLRSIGDAVIATDVQGRIKQMNPIAEELTGWTYQEARGLGLAEVFNLIHSITEVPVTSPVSKVLATGEIIGMSNHTVLLSRDGKRRQIADSAAPIRNAEGRIVGVVMVFRDVTEEYALQQALRSRARTVPAPYSKQVPWAWQ